MQGSVDSCDSDTMQRGLHSVPGPGPAPHRTATVHRVVMETHKAVFIVCDLRL